MSEYMQGGALANDDLDFSAPRERDRASERSSAAVKSPALNVAIGVSAVAVLVGLALWFMQLSGGMVQTAMRNLDSWGLYITGFMFFVGLSAGGLIISSVPKALGIRGFGGISKVAVFSSIACTVVAIGLVVVDMGQPFRVWELFVYSNLGSPLMWDIIVLGTYLILSCVYLWAQIQAERGKVSAVALRIVSVIALVTAVLVHSVTAWIFGLQQGHEMWHTALLAPWFVSSALVCGTALVMAIVIGLRRAGYLELEQDNVVRLAKLLGAFVLVDLYFFGCDLLTEGFPGGAGAEVVALLTQGPLAPYFWFEIIGCRHLPDPGPATQRPSGGGIAAGHRGHLLQARAAAGGRLPDRQPRSALCDELHEHHLRRRHAHRCLREPRLLAHAAGVRSDAGCGGPRVPHLLPGSEAPSPAAL